MRLLRLSLLLIFSVSAFAADCNTVGFACFNLDTQIKGSRLPFYGTDLGSANAYVVTTIAPLGPTLRAGSKFMFLAAHANTTSSTLNTDSTGVIAIKKWSSGSLVNLASGDISVNQWIEVGYDGTQYQLMSGAGVGGGVTSFSGDGTFATNSSSTGAVTLTLGNAGAHKWWGNNTGSTAAPGYETIDFGDLSGSATTGQLPGSGVTTINSTPCTIGSSCSVTGTGDTGFTQTTFRNNSVFLQEEFCTNQTAQTLGWVANGGGGSVALFDNLDYSDAHPCEVTLTGPSASSWVYYILGKINSGAEYINPQVHSGILYGVVDNNGGTVGVTRFGLFNNRGTATSSAGVWFEASGTGSTPNWHCITRNASVQEDNDSGVSAPSNTWHELEIDLNASSTVNFKIDGSSVCTNTTNVPNARLTPAFEALGNASGTAKLVVDYFGLLIQTPISR